MAGVMEEPPHYTYLRLRLFVQDITILGIWVLLKLVFTFGFLGLGILFCLILLKKRIMDGVAFEPMKWSTFASIVPLTFSYYLGLSILRISLEKTLIIDLRYFGGFFIMGILVFVVLCEIVYRSWLGGIEKKEANPNEILKKEGYIRAFLFALVLCVSVLAALFLFIGVSGGSLYLIAFSSILAISETALLVFTFCEERWELVKTFSITAIGAIFIVVLEYLVTIV